MEDHLSFVWDALCCFFLDGFSCDFTEGYYVLLMRHKVAHFDPVNFVFYMLYLF